MSAAFVSALVLLGLAWLVHSKRSGPPVDARRELALLTAHLARSVHSGATVLEAVPQAAERLSGEVARTTADLGAALERGVSLTTATQDLLDEVSRGPRREHMVGGLSRASRAMASLDADDVALVVYAVQFSDRYGVGLADAFDAVTVALMDRAELAQEIRALTSQAQASVWVLCAIPLLGVVILPLLAPQVFTALFTTSTGLALLSAAVVLDLGAIVVASRITRAVLR